MALPPSKYPVWGNPPTGGYEGHWQNSEPLTANIPITSPQLQNAYNSPQYQAKQQPSWQQKGEKFLGSFGMFTTLPGKIGIPGWVWIALFLFSAITGALYLDSKYGLRVHGERRAI